MAIGGCPRVTAGEQPSPARYGGVHTFPMPFNPFSRKQRIPRPRPATSDDQPLARKYYPGATTVRLSDCFWPDGTVVRASGLVWYIGTHGDISMGTIQTSLAALKEGSALATNVPFIAPIAGLLLQALTMRDARVTYTFPDDVLMIASPGSEAI
ncbi:hypothetical protein EDB84DRAFT_1482867 [Lactarius hengduanensis]|nr:hypothetical protein EDB84DRAFT_1482867 [Lactarius hengduanensis]